jgi:hypothetical protein
MGCIPPGGYRLFSCSDGYPVSVSQPSRPFLGKVFHGWAEFIANSTFLVLLSEGKTVFYRARFTYHGKSIER